MCFTPLSQEQEYVHRLTKLDSWRKKVWNQFWRTCAHDSLKFRILTDRSETWRASAVVVHPPQRLMCCVFWDAFFFFFNNGCAKLIFYSYLVISKLCNVFFFFFLPCAHPLPWFICPGPHHTVFHWLTVSEVICHQLRGHALLEMHTNAKEINQVFEEQRRLVILKAVDLLKITVIKQYRTYRHYI